MPEPTSNEPNQIDVSLSLLGADSGQALSSLISELKAITQMMRQIKAESSDQAARLGISAVDALSHTTTGTGGGASRSNTTVSSDTPQMADGTVIHVVQGRSQEPIAHRIPKVSDVTSEQMYDALPRYSGVSAGASQPGQLPLSGDEPSMSGLNFITGDDSTQTSANRSALADPLKHLPGFLGGNSGLVSRIQGAGIYQAMGGRMQELGGRLGPEALAYAAWQHASAATSPVPLTPGGVEGVGTQFGQPQGPINTGIPGLDPLLNSMPFTIPGSQYFTPAGGAGLHQSLDTVWDALRNSNISTRELAAWKAPFTDTGYTPHEVDRLENVLVRSFGGHKQKTTLKELGDLGTTAELADQMIRNLPKSDQNLKEMTDTLAQIPGAAHGARVGVEEFKSQLNQVANDLQGQGSMTFMQGAQTAIGFSGALHTPPQTLSTLTQNPIFQGQMVGQGYMPWQIGSAPPETLAKNMFRTFDLLGGSSPFKQRVTRRGAGLGSDILTSGDQRDQFIASQTGIPVETIKKLYGQQKTAIPRAQLSGALQDARWLSQREATPGSADLQPTRAGLGRAVNASHFSPQHRKELLDELKKYDPHKADSHKLIGDIQKKIAKWEGDKPGEGESKVTIELSHGASKFFGLKDDNKKRRNKGLSSRVDAFVQGPSPTSQPASGGEPIPNDSASFGGP